MTEKFYSIYPSAWLDFKGEPKRYVVWERSKGFVAEFVDEEDAVNFVKAKQNDLRGIEGKD